jgi:FtsZ-binding cell division protein ZapB
MSNKEYPLHPGQTQASPDYVQVPQSEYESLKRENAKLHALIHGVKSQDSNAEIDTLASECRALRSMNAKAQEEIATLKDERNWLAKDRAAAYNDLEKRTQENMKLKEAQRWRNFKDEPPEHHQWIEACYREDRINERLPRIEVRRWDDGMKFDVFEQELYIGWRPLPKAPEAE